MQPHFETSAGPATPVLRYPHIIRALVRREIESQVKGTVLGALWLVIGPLIMLSVYTLVFGVILGSRWQGQTGHDFLFPLIYFSGLILFNCFFDGISRAPNLLRDNQSFVKKIVFPVEVFPYAAVGSALARLSIGLALLALFYFALLGLPPLSVLTYPAILIGLMLYSLGFTLAIAAVSAFFRDLAHLTGPLAMITMFLSPLFYPVSAVPAALRPFIYLNPLTFALESSRNALFFGQWPSAWAVLLYTALGWLVALLGYRLFLRLQPGFADVV